jgi:P-type Ca2+ transporter type 2C
MPGQFQSLPVALLAGATIPSVLTGALIEAAAIAGVVALNGVIGYETESRAERTEALGSPLPRAREWFGQGRPRRFPPRRWCRAISSF